MSIKGIVIWIALCATLAAAIEQDVKSPPGNGYYHGLNNPNFPARVESISNEDIPIRENHVHKPHFLHSSEESQEAIQHNHHKPYFPHTSGESQDKWEHKKPHHYGWHIPHFPHHHEYSKESLAGLERRRPLFLPLYPYHPFYPHHPSHNDEEFETIEALKSRNYHESNNPNFPLNQDDSQEIYERPFYHGFHNPNFPFNFDSSEESSEEKPDFKIPSFLIDLYELLHNGHWKPGKPHHEAPLKEDNTDHEGSGEEEIIPLSSTADIPLVKDDNKMEYQNDDQDEENDSSEVVPAIGFRSFLESRKSIPIDCDALNTPRYSCYNCYNYLVCKPEGGKIKSCKDPYAPYCNNGICSNTPGPECPNL